MDYDELSIEIRGFGREDGAVEVRSSSYGRGTASCSLPAAVDDLDELLGSVERQVRHVIAPSEETERTVGRVDLEELGVALFEALFTDRATCTFERSFARVEERKGDGGEPSGLRIRMTFDPEDPDISPLSVIPWELLRRPETREFLATDRRTPVVRYLDVPLPQCPLTVEPPLPVAFLCGTHRPDGLPRPTRTGARPGAGLRVRGGLDGGARADYWPGIRIPVEE